MCKLFAAFKGKNLPLIGAISIIVAALLWSIDGIFLRPNLHSLPSTTVVFWEHFLGFIALSPFLWIYRGQLKIITRKQWLSVFWVVLFGGALGTAFITKAFFLTNFQDLSVVLLLQKLQPVFAITLAFAFLGEKLEKKFYLWAGLAIVSGYFVTFKDLIPNFDTGGKTILAAGFALLAAFAFGSSTTFGKYAVRTINYKLLAALRFCFTALLMLFVTLYLKTLILPAAPQWTTLIIIVFSSGAMAMFLYYYGLKKVAASKATLYELAWPISAVILDLIINKNFLSWTQLIAAAVLIYAVYRITRLQPVYNNIIGKVIKGGQLGRELGFKTANLDPNIAESLDTGIYLAEATVKGKSYSGLLHYGYNSLRNVLSLEVLLKDFDEDIYGENIVVEIKYKFREIKKFKNQEEAIKNITKDYELLKG